MSSVWVSVRLEELIAIKHGFAFPGANFSDEPTDSILLTPGNFRIGGGFKADKLKYYRGEGPKEYTLQPGDLIVTMTDLSKNMDTLGLPAWVPDFGDKVALHNQRLGLVQLVSEAGDRKFIYYLLSSSGYRAEVLASSTGTTVHHTSPKRILTYEFQLPPLPEQRGISATLGALDDKIESNRSAVGTALKLLDTLAVQVALDLSSTRLGELVKVHKDTVNPSTLGQKLVDHFSLPAFDAGARPERVAAASIMSNKLVVPGRSILLSRLNPRFNRTWWVTPESATKALASTEFLCMTTGDDEALAAVWLALRSESFTSELPRRVTGTSGSHQRVRPADVLEIEVPDVRRLPKSATSSALALLGKVEQLRRESVHLAELRDVLLPELLSGRIRVPEAEEVVAS